MPRSVKSTYLYQLVVDGDESTTFRVVAVAVREDISSMHFAVESYLSSSAAIWVACKWMGDGLWMMWVQRWYSVLNVAAKATDFDNEQKECVWLEVYTIYLLFLIAGRIENLMGLRLND